jgi:hypothetical protein
MQITQVNDRILEIADKTLESIGSVSNLHGGDAVRNQRLSLARVSENPEIKSTFSILRGQQLVLLVSALETYLRDMTRIIANEYPEILKWSIDTNYKIDLSELANPSVSKGDILLQAIIKQGTNFQDIGSIKRFFKSYLDIEIDIDELNEQQVILATAKRHVIVHENGVVNKEFMKNIRNLPEDVISMYKIDGALDFVEDDITSLRDSMLALSLFIEDALNAKINGARL